MEKLWYIHTHSRKEETADLCNSMSESSKYAESEDKLKPERLCGTLEHLELPALRSRSVVTCLWVWG